MGRTFTAVCVLLLVVGGARPVCASQTQAAESVPVVPLRLVVKGLGRGSIEVLRREVEAVWTAHGVRVVWTTEDVATAVLVVVDRPESALPPRPADEQWHIAATRILDGHIVPSMYVSIDAAARVAQVTSPPYSSPSLAGIIVPRVAARAIAHELAHFLLDTREHTRGGLLRARFSANDFVFPVRDAFVLNPAQVAAVHHRLEVSPLWPCSRRTCSMSGAIVRPDSFVPRRLDMRHDPGRSTLVCRWQTSFAP